ncbi:glutathione transferase GST 23 [Elaeis guineensis]|uniref:glutathione transferase n=1 Tax=Elaeis guineensis var. tenera TaxID=51953 RepID=A0A6I9S5X1_ELAGV|nr:glutathione transferase GST 23 [Elaeis guineensis]
MAKAEVKLLGTWSSPFVLRIKWALKMKGVEYDFIEEDLQNKSPLLLKYNPVHKKVPVLVHEGKPIAESLVILEYMDETWKENPILPEDPYQRAMARFWSKFGEEKCLPSIWRVFISQGENTEEALVSASENLKILEGELKGKKFFNGETLGFADISLGWIVNMVILLEEIMELKMIDDQRYPSLSAWMKNFSNFPGIRDSFPPQERMLTKYRILREALLATRGTN